jgi:AraC-like DNA-binding protein
VTRPQFLFPEAAQFGVDNVMLHARAHRHTVREFAGPLSIKTVVAGTVAWSVDGRALAVDPASFLVLGDGERYSMAIHEPRPVETACAFFRTGLVEEIAQDATTSVESSLDDPARAAPALPWISRLHADPDRRIVGRVQTLARRCAGELLPSAVEEDFLLLGRELLARYREVASRMAKIKAARASTREELFRRVEAGREYLHADTAGVVSWNAAARAACVSPYHFHRAFTQAVGITPHGYLTEIRLGRAWGMLKSGAPVKEACGAVGFTSVGSFSRLFRRRFGVAPGAVRRDSPLYRQ